jgi:flagella basal body P-ring formation protein FlgA
MTGHRSAQRGVLGSLVVLAWLAGAADVSAGDVSPQHAIERAAFERLGGAVVHVDVSAVATAVAAAADLIAVPDPAGIVGQRARFILTVKGQRQGVAVATVRVRAKTVQALTHTPRGEFVAADAVAVVEDDVHGVRYARLPEIDEVIGARAKRDLLPGAVVTAGMIAAPLDVRHGDRVTVGVSVGRVHVTGAGVASGSGYIGDVVHVTQAGRRTRLKGRITERGVVEVMP